MLVQQVGHILDAELDAEFLSEGEEELAGRTGLGEGLGHGTSQSVGDLAGAVGSLHVVEGFHAEGGRKDQVAFSAGLAHEAGHSDAVAGLGHGLLRAGVGGEGVHGVGGVHEEQGGSLLALFGHGLHVVHHGLLHHGLVAGGTLHHSGGEGKFDEAAFTVHAAEDHVHGHSGHDGTGGTAVAQSGACDDKGLLGGGEHADRGFEAGGGHAGDLAGLLEGVAGSEGGEPGEAVVLGGLAGLDEKVGHAEQEGHFSAGLDGQPEVGAGGSVVLHGAGVDYLLGGFLTGGVSAVEGAAVGGDHAPAFEQGSADGKDAVAVLDVVADAALAAHGFPCAQSGLFFIGHEVEVAGTLGFEDAGDDFVDAGGGVAGDGGHGAAGFGELGLQDLFGLSPGDGLMHAVGRAQERGADAGRADAQFSFGSGQSSDGALGDGVVIVGQSAHRSTLHDAGHEAGAGGAELADGGDIFAGGTLQLGHPAPVLRPVHGVVQRIPDDGGSHKAYSAAGGKFKKSSSIHDFLSFALLMAGEAGIAGDGVALGHVFGMAAFAIPHQHGVFGVARKPVFPIDRGNIGFSHVEVAGRAVRGDFLRALEVGHGAEMQSMAEENVVGLLLVDQPFIFDFTAGLNVVVNETRFFGILSLNSRMAHSALCRGRRAAESAVGTYEVAFHAGHALFLYMLDMAECNGLLLGDLHEVRQDPPAKNEGHDQPHDKRAPAAAAFLGHSRRCGFVIPLLHPDASCWLR